MAWSAKVDATQLTSITTEQFFAFPGASNVTLNPGETADVYVKFVPVASPTDSLVISVYGSLDAGTTYDVVPILTFMLDKGTSPNSASFLVSGYYSFRVGVKRSGTTDTITSADCSYRKDGISL
jgi:hypothetical protein